jgi:hypothetical protein
MAKQWTDEEIDELMADEDCTCTPAKKMIMQLRAQLKEYREETGRECAEIARDNQRGVSTFPTVTDCRTHNRACIEIDIAIRKKFSIEEKP